ncbi:cardiac-enriched FHL2-interacting protein [Amblyraja radiata]|uniref:cardiac-enriched FHL2-interacting protein n=1 Tax=Amblyraja radiata TaxID=386614 RepID=UPI001401F19D|nr:cardiac-enriched FHL2-interacting protein [Amblyraja radiata]XP_032868484.1 cardiac-enriched FHL2-interacting protein [Amblyraja radiata]
MDSFKNRGAAKTRKMQGHSKVVDGFSDTSSAGSFLDEADREVSSLTERAFKSLCVVEEAVCSEFDAHSSPSLANVNRAAPGPGGKKHSAGELKNCKMPPKLIKKRAKDLPETFQESAGQYCVGGEKGNLGNGFLVETKEQKAKGSSLPRDVDHKKRDFTGTDAINAKAASGVHPEPAGEDGVKDIAQFDVSSIINLHREKSSFSAACQESYWVNKTHLPQAKGSKTNILGYLKASQCHNPTDLKNLNPTGKKLDKVLSDKVSRVKKADIASSFLHSECSAFKSWRDHSKSLSEEDNPPETHYPTSLQSNVPLQGSDEDVIVQIQAPSLAQVKSPHKVIASMMQNPGNRSPCNKDAAQLHASVPEENHYIVKESQDPDDHLQGTKCEEGGGGSVENGVEEKGFQLWRNSRFPLHKKQMEAELVSEEVPATRCPPVAEAAASDAAIPQEATSLCISKLLTPNLMPNVNGIETSKNQPVIVTPPLFIQPAANQSDEMKGDNQSQLGYRAKASSLLYNLKDVRKRVKSTYSTAAAPQNIAEPARDKYVFQNIHQTSARTSSAPVRLRVRENCATDANDQGKLDTMSHADGTRPTAARLNAAEIPPAELDPWKDDDYLNLRSPQTVREAGGYPRWRTRGSRPQSAITSLEVHAGRCRDRRSSQQLNNPNAKVNADLPAKAVQSARNSPEGVTIALEREEQKQNRLHVGRKPGCELVSHIQQDIRTHGSQTRKQEGLLMQQRVEDGGSSSMDRCVPSHQGPCHPAGEGRTRLDVKSSGQSYIDLGNSYTQGPEQMNDLKEQSTGCNADDLKGRPTLENDKSCEKIELQYYALSDPTINSERGGEKQNAPLVFQSHSQPVTPRGLPETRTQDSASVGFCEEMFDSIVSKQQELGPGSHVLTSPRLGLFKVKDNAPIVPTKPLLPKGEGQDAGINTLRERPTMFTPNETREEGKRDSGKVLLASSVTPNARPESTCSMDSKAAGKPPVVPPKSEKALRRAKKLATRRKRTENKQDKQSSGGTDIDIALSNMPVCALSQPTSPLPSVCPSTPPDPFNSCASPAIADTPAGTSTMPFTSAPSFPLSQRKVLQDPESGQYFVVDIPIQVQRKTLFDPETGNYFQVSIPSAGRKTTIDFLNTSYVLYPGFPALPLLSTVRPPSQMSAPAVLDLHKEEGPFNERTNFDLGYTEEQENQPYIETFYDPYTGSRAGSEKEIWCSPMSSQTLAGDHDLELIFMGDLEDIAMENN